MSIFDFPRIYTAKSTVLSGINGMSRSFLDAQVRGKDVLDIGCGTFQYLYDTKIVRSRTGVAP
jgi:hypothetical protein